VVSSLPSEACISEFPSLPSKASPHSLSTQAGPSQDRMACAAVVTSASSDAPLGFFTYKPDCPDSCFHAEDPSELT
jgi:hypothetical protein